jgi:acyl carrier protein phosphodiesterase
MPVKTVINPEYVQASQEEQHRRRVARITLDLLMQRLQSVRTERARLVKDEARLQQLILQFREQQLPQETTLPDEFLRTIREGR